MRFSHYECFALRVFRTTSVSHYECFALRVFRTTYLAARGHTKRNTPTGYTVRELGSDRVPSSPPGGETNDNGVTRHILYADVRHRCRFTATPADSVRDRGWGILQWYGATLYRPITAARSARVARGICGTCRWVASSAARK